MTPDPASDCWLHNLEALRPVDPACADRLAALPIPSSVQPAVGRDGSTTWRICRDAGRIEWFGRTSMPTVSAESLLAGFQPGLGNVALGGIGSGREAWLLPERLGRHRSVVVLETDPLNLALALRLWDIADALRARQVVLLLARDLNGLREALLQFCCQHPGFELPTRLLAWPWRSKADNQACTALIEQVAGRLRPLRSEALLRHVEQLRQAHRPGKTPRAVAVLTGVPAIVTGRRPAR